MLSNIPQAYDLSDATLEILFMLLVAFLLGFLFAWLIKKWKNRESSKEAAYVAPKTKSSDNLKIIEGVGPKIEMLLNKAGIKSFDDVIETNVTWLQKILDNAGSKYKIHNPKTWPDQAELAVEGRWGELKEYQDILNGGKDS